jgi:hypothetical protein
MIPNRFQDGSKNFPRWFKKDSKMTPKDSKIISNKEGALYR